MYNGVHITDLTRYFPPSEWWKLTPEINAEARALKAQKKRNVADVNVTTSQSSNSVESLTENDAGNAFGSSSYPECGNGSKRSKTNQGQQQA
jgi:hypothetical protein